MSLLVIVTLQVVNKQVLILILVDALYSYILPTFLFPERGLMVVDVAPLLQTLRP